jgi:predicted amidohydrolase
MSGNLIDNGDFARGTPGALPTGWEAVCPNPALSPRFLWICREEGGGQLRACGNGRSECFGYVRHKVILEPGKTYRMAVRFTTIGLEDINRHLVHGIFGEFNEGILEYVVDGDHVVGERTFLATGSVVDPEIRLYFRFSADGRVCWDQVSLVECDPIPPRTVKVACSWGRGDLAYWAEWLDRAGELGVDLCLLPEMFDGNSPNEAEPLDGPSGSLLADKARQWHMYVSGSFYERRGDLVHNVAPLFERSGGLLGAYRKTQLYDPEEDQGVTPGTELPVFRTDFGSVGIAICYDSWFPEIMRLLAYKGADLVLLPNAGYFTGLLPARAADNGVWIAVSSLNCPAGVWDPSGARAGEVAPNPTRYAPSSILSYFQDESGHMVAASLDLSRRYSPHWWGGPMRSAPGGRRVRQTSIAPIEDEIALEAKRWWRGEGRH